MWVPKKQFPISFSSYPGTGPLTPTLTAAAVSGESLVINWMGTATLEFAPNINGPWEVLAYDAVGPYTIPIGTTPGQFYRVRSQQRPLQ